MDARSILILTALQSAVIGAALLLHVREYRGPIRGAMSCWGGACLVTTVGWIGFGLRGQVPDFLSVVCATVCLLAGTVLYYESWRRLDGEKPAYAPLAAVVGVSFFFQAVFLYGHNDVVLRSVISNGIAAAFLGACAVRLYFWGPEKRTALRAFLGHTYLLLMAVYVLRGVMVLVVPRDSLSVVANTPLNIGVYMTTSVCLISIAFGLVLVCNERVNAELVCMAGTDSLTGLMNRRAAEDQAAREIARSVRTGEPLSMVLLDADDFKFINDRFGHKTGDRALVAIADALRRGARAQDTLARIGGDEFMVLLPGVTEENAVSTAFRYTGIIAQIALVAENLPVPVRASAGAASLDPQNPSYDDLYGRSDRALYARKRTSGLD